MKIKKNIKNDREENWIKKETKIVETENETEIEIEKEKHRNTETLNIQRSNEGLSECERLEF